MIYPRSARNSPIHLRLSETLDMVIGRKIAIITSCGEERTVARREYRWSAEDAQRGCAFKVSSKH